MPSGHGTPTHRALTVADAQAVAAVSRRARFDAIPDYPDLHTPDEDTLFYAGEIASSTGLAAVSEDGRIMGFILWRDRMVQHLHVDVTDQHGGIGTSLLAAALAQMPERPVRLWTFEANERAVAFYRAHGFRVVDRTDGSGNEERLPDLLLELG